jgi:hypothetical protein
MLADLSFDLPEIEIGECDPGLIISAWVSLFTRKWWYTITTSGHKKRATISKFSGDIFSTVQHI